MPVLEVTTETMGQRIKRLRKLHHMSQKQLAALAGISWRGLAELESDKLQGMQTRHLGSICKALGVSADWLLGLAERELE